MQKGNIYSVHKNSYGFCTDWGEFKTLEEANECFYRLVREELEERNPNHQHYFHVYMLHWAKDHSWHETIRVWDIEKGYTTDFPRESKSWFKILKQLYIKRKVLRRRGLAYKEVKVFTPKCEWCGKSCTKVDIRRFVSFGTMTYFDICADCYCRVSVEQKKKDRYTNWLEGELVHRTTRFDRRYK